MLTPHVEDAMKLPKCVVVCDMKPILEVPHFLIHTHTHTSVSILIDL